MHTYVHKEEEQELNKEFNGKVKDHKGFPLYKFVNKTTIEVEQNYLAKLSLNVHA